MVTDNLPWVESPFFEDILKTKKLSAEEMTLAKAYHDNGYVVISGLFTEELIDKVREDAETKAFNPDSSISAQRGETRVQDFWKVSEACRELAVHPKVLEKLKLLYARQPIPFQTLNFSMGTQQRSHSDTIHFSSLPAKYMCGVWVALEDITEENGPVFYYSGSHRLPEYNFSAIQTSAKTTSYEDYAAYENFIEKVVTANKFEKKKFLAKKGDMLIWSSNIIHGGSPVNKPDTSRWSQVTHYFFEDCFYYTPMLSNMVTNELFLRDGLENIRTGKKVVQNYNGEHISYIPINKKGLYILTNNLKRLKSIYRFFVNSRKAR